MKAALTLLALALTGLWVGKQVRWYLDGFKSVGRTG